MRYAYVQIKKPVTTDQQVITDCFIILEYFDDLEEVRKIHEIAPYRDRYIIIPEFSGVQEKVNYD